MTKLEALRNQKLLLFNLPGNLLDQVCAAMEEYTQSLLSEKDKEIDLLERRDVAWSQKKEQLEELLSEKESLIIELTNKVAQQEKKVERYRKVLSRVLEDHGYKYVKDALDNL